MQLVKQLVSCSRNARFNAMPTEMEIGNAIEMQYTPNTVNQNRRPDAYISRIRLNRAAPQLPRVLPRY